jgi:putative photosynthetic complex assembly protein 2
MNWPQLWLPVAITVFAWWFSTGLILLLVRLPRTSHSALLIIFAGIGLIAGWGVVASAGEQTTNNIYCGFLCTLLIWGWHEASFLMGKITGPRPQPCPIGAKGLHRFGYATATLIYHEVALFCTLIAIAALTWQAANQISLWTFALLFAMRLSAKFNIFLGVPNLTEEFFPVHLEHLKSYLPKRPMNPLMPVSLLISLALAIWLWRSLIPPDQSDGETIALAIVLTLTCLGILEHLFMITPLPDAALWRWAVPRPRDTESEVNNPSTDVRGDLKKSENG